MSGRSNNQCFNPHTSTQPSHHPWRLIRFSAALYHKGSKPMRLQNLKFQLFRRLRERRLQRLWTELVVNWILLRSVAVCSSQQGAEKLQNLFHWSSHLLCAGYYIVITATLLPPVHSDPSTWILLAWWAELRRLHQFSDEFVKESSSHSNSYHSFLHILLPMGRYQYFSSVPWNFA